MTQTLDEILQEVASLREAAGPVRVLVVDDEKSILTMLSMVLKRRGYHVAAVGTASEALNIIEERQPQVVVTDKNLPDKTGLDIIRQGKKLSQHTEFILMTGFSSLESAVEAIQAGAFAYVTKPFKDVYDVVQRVDAAVERTMTAFENRALLQKLKDAYKHLLRARVEIDMMGDVVKEQFTRRDTSLREGLAELYANLKVLRNTSNDLVGEVGGAQYNPRIGSIHQLATRVTQQCEALGRSLTPTGQGVRSGPRPAELASAPPEPVPGPPPPRAAAPAGWPPPAAAAAPQSLPTPAWQVPPPAPAAPMPAPREPPKIQEPMIVQSGGIEHLDAGGMQFTPQEGLDIDLDD